MGMKLDEGHAVLLEPGAGQKLVRPELLVTELDRVPPGGGPGRDTFDPPSDVDAGNAVVLAPAEGERLSGDERVAIVKAGLPELTLSVFELGPSFEGPEPHRHEDHVDLLRARGDVEFVLGDDAVRAGPGTFFAAPPGIVHTFTNPGPAGARLLNMHAPDAGFLDFLRQN
jgi:quercetin dioxygenase-like cupin family protein